MRSVLFISNEANDIADLGRILTKEKFRFIVSKSPSETFDLLGREHIDSVIFASQIGVDKGIDFFLTIKSKLISSGVFCFLLLDKKVSKEELIVCLEFGFENILFKPFDSHSLVGKLKNAFQKLESVDFFKTKGFHQYLEGSVHPLGLFKRWKLASANTLFLEQLEDLFEGLYQKRV